MSRLLRPRLRPQVRPLGRSPGLAVVLGALVGLSAGCDERLAQRLAAASKRQEEREQAEARARREGRRADRSEVKEGAVPPEVRELLDVVEHSDYQFVVTKGDQDRAMNGPEFVSMLETKTRFLGVDIEHRDAWLKEIGSGTFFGQKPYRVRLPGGEELDFSSWVVREAAVRRRFAGASGDDTSPKPAPTP